MDVDLVSDVMLLEAWDEWSTRYCRRVVICSTLQFNSAIRELSGWVTVKGFLELNIEGRKLLLGTTWLGGKGMMRGLCPMEFGNAVFDTDYFTPTSYARSRMSLA